MMVIITVFGAVLARSPRDEEDAALLRRIVKGEESAIAELFDRYHRLLYTFGFRILKSEEDARDLLQEVFLQAWNKASAYEIEKGTVYTWLVTMTRNRAIDTIRSKGYKERSQAVDILDVNLIADRTSSNPYAAAVFVEDQQNVVRALKNLTTDQQQVIALAYYEGFSQSEIAGKLNIPLGTVKTRMRKGLMELRTALTK
ncbi:MAG TPA: sigma-70 family RNA polymerase sigma factor [Bacteroidota bacterium]|nr:sigma-70 family RNA polymerase sigma factor [Bacteroidota bacterium]